MTGIKSNVQPVIKPSIVNDSPSDDVRVEMEMDAKEIMEQFGVTVKELKSTRKEKILKIAQDISYVLLVLVSIGLAFAWRYQVDVYEKLLHEITTNSMPATPKADVYEVRREPPINQSKAYPGL